MPKFDEKRCVINGVQVSVPVYLRYLASEPQYANQREDMLNWAKEYEDKNGTNNIEF